MVILGFGKRPQAMRRLRDATAASIRAEVAWRETPGDYRDPAKQQAYERLATAAHEEISAMGGTDPLLTLNQYNYARAEGQTKVQRA